jgi:hypothetical protein
MPKTTAQQLHVLVARLQRERQVHVKALAEIDAIFAGAGVPAAPVRSVRPVAVAKPKVGGKAKRRRFAVSGTNSILEQVRQGGKEGATSGNIAKQWKREGRAGSAFNILGQLVREGRLRRHKLRDDRGSRYVLG